MITVKKTTQDPKHGIILEPFFGRNMTILYSPDTELELKKYVVKMDKNLIPAGQDKRGIPVFIRRCVVLRELND